MALLVSAFEPTHDELDVILESKGRASGDEGVKLLAELINKGQRRVYRDSDRELGPAREIQ